MATLQENLQKVHDSINFGWCQGSFWRRNGKPTNLYRGGVDVEAHCLKGALIGATALMSERKAMYDALHKVLGLGDEDDLANWQDDPARTKEEVLAVIKKAMEVNG
jgi:hypothetical protein